jgi:hypothetical protein
MRDRFFSILSIALCTTCLSAPVYAGSPFGLGGIFGLVTAPLHAVTHGVAGALGSGRAMHRPREASAHALPAPPPQSAPPPVAASAPPVVKEATPETTPERPLTQAKLEAPPGQPPRNDQQATPAMPPPAAWPASSPNVYEDLLGYILWPRDYGDRLWAHGYDDIVGAVLTPAAAARSGEAASMIANGMCNAEAASLADKPIARVGEILTLTDEQRARLDEVRVAIGLAIERGRAALCGNASQAPGEPLKAMREGLWTMWDATILMRAPLERFLNSLTPEQRATLLQAGETASTPGACAEPPPAGPDRAAMNERLAQAIEAMAGRNPSPDQRAKLDALRAQLGELAKFLATSCPQSAELSPIGRLSAAGERMNALMYVVVNLSPSLSAFRGPPASGH